MLLKFYVKGRQNLPKIIDFFVICANLKKIYVTNFAQSWFWWIAGCVFNIIKRIFIQILVQVDPHVDYTHVVNSV